jgi:uncharacterized protein (TIGR02266 family)
MADATQRRRTPRFPVRIPVSISTIDQFLDSEIMNLSKGGIFIKADITLPLGTEVDLEFVLPKSGREISAVGTVVWTRRRKIAGAQAFPGHPFGMGIQFKDIDMGDIELILDEIEAVMAESTGNPQ